VESENDNRNQNAIRISFRFFFEFRAPLGICAHGNAFGNLEQLNGKTFTLDCNVIRTDVFLNGWNIHPPGERTKPNPTRCGRHKLTYRGNKNETSKAASAFDWDQDAANLAAPLWHPENIFQKKCCHIHWHHSAPLVAATIMLFSVWHSFVAPILLLRPNCDHFFMAKVSAKEAGNEK